MLGLWPVRGSALDYAAFDSRPAPPSIGVSDSGSENKQHHYASGRTYLTPYPAPSIRALGNQALLWG